MGFTTVGSYICPVQGKTEGVTIGVINQRKIISLGKYQGFKRAIFTGMFPLMYLIILSHELKWASCSSHLSSNSSTHSRCSNLAFIVLITDKDGVSEEPMDVLRKHFHESFSLGTHIEKVCQLPHAYVCLADRAFFPAELVESMRITDFLLPSWLTSCWLPAQMNGIK